MAHISETKDIQNILMAKHCHIQHFNGVLEWLWLSKSTLDHPRFENSWDFFQVGKPPQDPSHNQFWFPGSKILPHSRNIAEAHLPRKALSHGRWKVGCFWGAQKKRDRIHEPECRNGSYVKTATQLTFSYSSLSYTSLSFSSYSTLSYSSYSTLSYSTLSQFQLL